MSGSPGAEKQVRYERVEELFRAQAPMVLAYAMRRGVQRAAAGELEEEVVPLLMAS